MNDSPNKFISPHLTTFSKAKRLGFKNNKPGFSAMTHFGLESVPDD
jgi:hypothetical protein